MTWIGGLIVGICIGCVLMVVLMCCGLSVVMSMEDVADEQ